jgi:hypothetical protein
MVSWFHQGLIRWLTLNFPGANSGIGFDTSYALANASPDNHVIMGARSSAKGLAALAEIQDRKPAGTLSFLELDITSDESIKAAAKKLSSAFGALDVLVNNAGISGKEEVSRENFQTVFNTNVFGTMLLTQALEPLLQKSLAPQIINVSSVLGSITVRNDHSSAYTQVSGPRPDLKQDGLRWLLGSTCSPQIMVRIISLTYTGARRGVSRQQGGVEYGNWNSGLSVQDMGSPSKGLVILPWVRRHQLDW